MYINDENPEQAKASAEFDHDEQLLADGLITQADFDTRHPRPIGGPARDPWAAEDAAKAREGATFVRGLYDSMSGRIDNWSQR